MSTEEQTETLTAPHPKWKEQELRIEELEREVTKWKALYRENFENEKKLTEQLDREQLEHETTVREGRIENEQLHLSLKQSETRYTEMQEALAEQAGSSTPSQKVLQELADVKVRFDEVSHLYSELLGRYEGKSHDVDAMEADRHEIMGQVAEQSRLTARMVEEARSESIGARQKLAEMEHEHLELSRAYRDLNDKYIKLRQELSES